MTTSFKPVSVAIGDLVSHPANVRSNSPETYDPENIAHLKASIAVLGLLQPLMASSSKKEIVAFCDKLFAEPFATLTDAQRAAVAAWCPPMMQTAGVACDEAEPAAETPEPDGDIAQAA